MPEEHPLQALVALEVVGEAEGVVLVRVLEEVEDLGGRLVDGVRWRDGVVDQNRNTA